jgi:hypothetical protein
MEPIWSPSPERIARAQLTRFTSFVRERHRLVELAVREVVHGRAVKNVDALANPQALDYFRHLPELQA